MINIEKYKDYELLIENEELQFVRINNVTNDVIKNYKIYEIDHERKAIYLELVKSSECVLIVRNDELELPIATVKNINEASKILGVEATHIYRAWRNANKPERLKYNNFILIFLTI